MYLKINALGDYKKKYDPFARLLALKRGVGVCSVVGVVSGFYGINKCCDLEHHPLPTLDDTLAKLLGGSKFTKLDLFQAYNQLKLSLDSRVFTTINTHRGLYEYTRLPFGVNSAV